MGSSNSTISEHLLRFSPMADVQSNDVILPAITVTNQNGTTGSNGAGSASEVRTKKKRGFLGSILSLFLFPALHPVAIVCAVSGEIARLLGAAPYTPAAAASEPVDTGYRCRRHSSTSFSDLRVEQLEAFYKSTTGCNPRKPSAANAPGGGRRNSVRRASLQHRLTVTTEPPAKYIASGESHRHHSYHKVAPRLSRVSLSLTSLPNLEQIDERHSKLWKLLLMPILLPIWFLDLLVYLIKSPIRLSQSVVNKLYDDPLPPPRRHSTMRRPSKSMLMLPGSSQSFY